MHPGQHRCRGHRCHRGRHPTSRRWGRVRRQARATQGDARPVRPCLHTNVVTVGGVHGHVWPKGSAELEGRGAVLLQRSAPSLSPGCFLPTCAGRRGPLSEAKHNSPTRPRGRSATGPTTREWLATAPPPPSQAAGSAKAPGSRSAMQVRPSLQNCQDGYPATLPAFCSSFHPLL